MKWFTNPQNLNYTNMREFFNEVWRILCQTMVGILSVILFFMIIICATPIVGALLLTFFLLILKILFDELVKWVKNLISR